jgi:hypothetical protein
MGPFNRRGAVKAAALASTIVPTSGFDLHRKQVALTGYVLHDSGTQARWHVEPLGCRGGLEDEAMHLRAAAHALHVRATQERAQAATNGPEEANTARELGARGRSGWRGECSSERLDSHHKVSG